MRFEFFTELEQDIKNAYENSPTIDEAEKLAAKFLSAQIQVSGHLGTADLDARMKKTGVKTIKASVSMEVATKGEKKPSDTFIEAAVNLNKLVSDSQNGLDEAEVYRNHLEHLLHVCREAHIFFRGVAKGRFE